MRKIFIFIGLKIAEISIIIFYPYYVAIGCYKLGIMECNKYIMIHPLFDIWIDGVFIGACAPFLVFVVFIFMYKLNWGLTNKINKHYFERK
jgi:hypothetical protein